MTDSSWPTGLMVIQGNHLEELRSVMTAWIRQHPLGPLENEQILVQSNGIAQWLKMALAEDVDNGGCGIAAAMKVQLPGRFLWQAYRCFEPDIPKISPFDKGPLTWTLFHLLSDLPALQQSVADPSVLTPLLGFLLNTDSPDVPDPESLSVKDPRRTHQLAAKLADLYDQYQIYRPDWLAAWEAGSNEIYRLKGNKQEALSGEQLWQPELWRLVTRTITGQQPDMDSWALKSRAAVHTSIVQLCQTLSEAPEDLPRRVIVFGISALPHSTLEFLEAISKFTQVMLFVHNPSEHYWGDLIEDKKLLGDYNRIQQRKLDASLNPDDLHLQGNPLLASWGKQGRDYLHLLDERDRPEDYRNLFTDNRIDLFESPVQGLTQEQSIPLLTQLQDDIYELRSLDERKALSQMAQYQIDPTSDRSVEFLIAHSAQREVEILHDQLLNEFEQAKAAGRTLNPRDILVMVPDINVYAPHIQAVFGRYGQITHGQDSDGKRDKRFIPFHISDQSQRGRNSLLSAFETLLHSRDARFTVSELLDLLDTPALLARFGLEHADLSKLHHWIQGANVRWGLDHEHRQEIGLGEAGEQNTWLFGLQRMLLGYAAGSSGAWTLAPESEASIEPYDEVAGLEAALLGPLVLLVNEIIDLRKELQQEKTAQQWEELFNQVCERFFRSQGKGDLWALDNIKMSLEKWREVCEFANIAEFKLPPEVARDELLGQIDQPTLTQKFLGGSVNFATLMPMRAIPFRQIWMLGMNDSDYPRSQKKPDFDLMANDYRPGDRSRREDDRYLFLEALLSARDKLVISWVGRNIRDNSEKPASVLVGQLRDYLESGWSSESESLLSAITTEHPLQPFSRSYFSPDAEQNRLFTYAKEWRQVHDSFQWLEPEMPPLNLEANIGLKDLAALLRHPVKSFYQKRLGVSWYDQGETSEDDETFAFDGLGKWSLWDRLLNQVQQGYTANPEIPVDQHLEQSFKVLKGAGFMPIGHFADSLQQNLQQELLPVLEGYLSLLAEYPCNASGAVHLLPLAGSETAESGEARYLEAQLLDYRKRREDASDAVRILLQSSNLYKDGETKHYHLVKFWPEHLLAQLDQPTTTYLLGSNSDAPIIFKPLPEDDAKLQLDNLQKYWCLGMQHPLPVACKTGIKWLFEADKARKEYEGDYNYTGELESHPGYQRLWPDFEQLTEDGRFSELAKALYQPMLDNLKRDDASQNDENPQVKQANKASSDQDETTAGKSKTISLVGGYADE